MNKKYLITISRQYGSGGREVGKRLAELLGVPFYDKELIEMAAAESGIDKELFETEGERTSKGFNFLGVIGYTLGSPVAGLSEMTLNDRMFLVQSQVIQQIAAAGSAVIVGRCADYVLREDPYCINVFIHSNLESRKRRAIEEYGVDREDAKDILIKTDKRRANYYNYYTDRKWGKAENYHIAIDSSRFELEEIAEMIAQLVKSKQ